MLTDTTTKPLPGPKSFFGLKNIRDMGQKGMLEFIDQQWHEHGDLFEVQVGRKLVIVHPNTSAITLTAPRTTKSSRATIGAQLHRGDGLVTSTGELWKRRA
jgi:hypothetical protein